MDILAGSITKGQAVALILLCVFVFIFIVVDIYLVLSLRRKNKKLAKNSENYLDESVRTSPTNEEETHE